MKNTLTIILLMIATSLFGQRDPNKAIIPIVEEGKMLYRSEMASWYGTDIFMEKYKDRKNIGGYFSYSEKEVSKCIFFSKSDIPKVIGTITFDSTYDVHTANIDLTEREFTNLENSLYLIRENALNEIRQDTLFKTYKNTNLNLIPLVNGKEKKVYVLTGPQIEGVVVFGNDYLLCFDKNNKLKSKKKLHNNIIPIEFKPDDKAVESIHSHSDETGPFITAADICTLMLYEKMTNWKLHSVVSAKYTSIWYCDSDTVLIMTNKALKKIYGSEENKEATEKSE